MEKSQANTNIVVVCWNALEYTKFTLSSLFEATQSPYCLTLVDNASSDGTVEYLSNLIPPKNCVNIEIIFNKENIGYGGAINQGYEISKKINAKFTCVCNNDLLFESGWLNKLEDVLLKDNKIGIVGTMRPSVHIKHPYYEGSAKSIVDSTPESFGVEQEVNYYTKNTAWDKFVVDLKRINHTQLLTLNCPPEVVVTCCALVNNQAIEEVGHLADPQFLIYGSEDVDLSWTLQKLGYKCCVDNSVYTHHFRHKSITVNRLDRDKHLKVNNQLFFNKWSPTIYSFLSGYSTDELKRRFNNGEDESFWLLRLLNKNLNFWDGERIV